ncbi:hypothetical protein Dimus_038965 [Dionaea muscipula]
MVERATRMEDAMLSARGAGQKRTREEPTQSQNQSGSYKKKFHPSQSEDSSLNSQQDFCQKCRKHHSRGLRCDGKPLTCFTCGKTGHKASVCRSGGKQQSHFGSQNPQGQYHSYQQNQGRQQTANSDDAANQKSTQSADIKGKGMMVNSERPLIPGRVYTLTQVDEETSPSVVQGTSEQDGVVG